MNFLIAGFILWAIYELHNETKILNDKLEKILEHIGISEVDENLENELKELLSKGEYVKSIRRYRIATNKSLKSSKEFIDSLKSIMDSEKDS